MSWAIFIAGGNNTPVLIGYFLQFGDSLRMDSQIQLIFMLGDLLNQLRVIDDDELLRLDVLR